jgi:hypothetical protein
VLTQHRGSYTSAAAVAEPAGPGSDSAEPVGLVEVAADGAEPTFDAAADAAGYIRRMEAVAAAED